MGELIVPVLMLILSVVFFIGTYSLGIVEGFSMNARSFPKALAIMIFCCSIILIFKFILNYKKYIKTEKEKIMDKRVFYMIFILIMFYFGLEFFGYIVSSVLFTILVSMFFQKKKYHLIDTIIIPIVLPLVLYNVFKFMGIYLPMGKLFNMYF